MVVPGGCPSGLCLRTKIIALPKDTPGATYSAPTPTLSPHPPKFGRVGPQSDTLLYSVISPAPQRSPRRIGWLGTILSLAPRVHPSASSFDEQPPVILLRRRRLPPQRLAALDRGTGLHPSAGQPPAGRALPGPSQRQSCPSPLCLSLERFGGLTYIKQIQMPHCPRKSRKERGRPRAHP